jgi:DNA topoisomerase III
VTTLIITEKTSQKKDLAAAIGNEYGQILPAEGHLLSLQEPLSVNSAWGKWSFDLLKPDDFYPTCPAPDASPSARGKLKAIEEALKKASRVILATDCDREGQLIGEELLRHYNFQGPVGRAIFTAQDEKTLRQAFENLEPNENYLNLGQAALARQQADQVYNLSLTRAATVALKQPGEYGAIGIGRVKTPTMAIVCIRELEILDFKPADYYHLVATANTTAGKLDLRYAPKEKILDQARAESLCALADGFEGPIKAVMKVKRTKPPKLLDLPELQKICARKWGWSATKTLDVAQELYDGDGKKIQTYPRAESRYLAENQIADIDEIVKGLKSLEQYQNLDMGKPEIRKGKSGHFSDAGLKGVSHHAIIPNKNTMDQIARIYPRLSDDERKMFDLVSSSYLAILLPDYVYQSTTVSLPVPTPEGEELLFKVTGNIPKELGWRTIFTDEMEKKEDHAGELPPVQDGDIVRLSPVILDTKKTKAPSRFNEGSLIDAMQNAWRFVSDKSLQERLKEAKGIGTPATRAAIILGLKKQNFITQNGKHIVPTPAGLALYKALKQAAPELVDPGVTALWEMKLDDILEGKQTARQVWDEIGDATSRLISVIRDNAARVPKIMTGVAPPKDRAKFGNGKPTEKMIATATSIATRKGIKAPKKFDTDFQVCKDFLDEHLGGNPLIAIEKRLGSGLIRGLGPVAAKAVVATFGVDALSIVEDTPERLSEVKGVGPKIVTAAVERKQAKEIGKQLAEYGISRHFGLRLSRCFKEEALTLVHEKPYEILKAVSWFGFDNADKIAYTIGLSPDDPARLQAALLQMLNIPREKGTLIAPLSKRLNVSPVSVENTLKTALSEKLVVEEERDGILYVERRDTAETKETLGTLLKSLSGHMPPWQPFDTIKAVQWAQEQTDTVLEPTHTEILSSILSRKATVLLSNKNDTLSCIINPLIHILNAKKVTTKIVTAFQSAATSVKTALDEKAEPVLKVLGWDEATQDFKHSAQKPLKCQFLILFYSDDMDPEHLRALLTATPKEAAVLILQEERNTFFEMAAYPLEERCRRLQWSILNNPSKPVDSNSQKARALASLFKTGECVEEFPPSAEADFFILSTPSEEKASATALELIHNRLPAKFEVDSITDIQLLCDKAAGPAGVNAFNKQAIQLPQKEKNPSSVNRFGHLYKSKSKIILTQDAIDKGLGKGEVGIIKKIDAEAQLAKISFSGKSLEFEFDELDIVAPAYAIPATTGTVSESKIIVVISNSTTRAAPLYRALKNATERVILVEYPA